MLGRWGILASSGPIGTDGVERLGRPGRRARALGVSGEGRVVVDRGKGRRRGTGERGDAPTERANERYARRFWDV
jgi:hypothetical protein